MIQGAFTLAGTKNLQLQYYAQSVAATNGLGVDITTGEVEVYAQISFIKLP